MPRRPRAPLQRLVGPQQLGTRRRWRLACLSPRIFCPRSRPMLSRKGGEKRRERTGNLTVPDARRNDEDRASTHEDVNGLIVGQEDHLDLAVENVEKLVAVRMELPRPLRCESPDGDSAFRKPRAPGKRPGTVRMSYSRLSSACRAA